MKNAWRSTLVAPGSLLFGALVALNVVWLVADERTTRDEASNVNAYGACRSAIRQARPQAARGVFPTLDLIRVSRADSARYTVRGFFQDRQRVVSLWYTCTAVRLTPDRWHVENVVFDERDHAAPVRPTQ